jgi:hypothetical protein
MGEELEKFIIVRSLRPIQGNFLTKKYNTENHFMYYRTGSSVFLIEEGLRIEESETLFIGDLKNFYITIE